ncbi:hypothetical protein ACFL27_22985 [candidate division CSSED10-310 bacterium]|uniref:Replicative helicase inhibitor G39P N-terminal domain-containing protein n=1 Tax=candidate division CSSED10-310 bacterium TaxID=2855610 RepID=A0ABV6Z3Q5_UNCC1
MKNQIKIAPKPILIAALKVLHVAAYTTRNWTISKEVSRKQINDLWEAIHEIPDLLSRWDDSSRCEKELKMYLNEYNEKWKSPCLESIFKQSFNDELSKIDEEDELLRAIKSLKEMYPDWRIGQLISNVSVWKLGPKQESIWDIEDREFIEAVKQHLKSRKGTEQGH